MAPPVDRPSPLRAIARQVVIWLPVVAMLWAITVRSGIVDGFFSRALTDCGGCLRPLVLKHDLPLLALLVIAQIAGIASRTQPLSIALRLFACGVLLVYFVDMVIFDLFTHRLNLIDIAGYRPEFRAIKAIFAEYAQRPQNSAVAIVLLGLLVCVALAFVRVRPMRLTRAIEYLVAPAACFASRQRNLFLDTTKAQAGERCIVHSRGDETDAVDVFCGERRGRVRLDGDSTAAVSGYVPTSVLDDINRERVAWFVRRGADGVVTRSLPPPATP